MCNDLIPYKPKCGDHGKIIGIVFVHVYPGLDGEWPVYKDDTEDVDHEVVETNIKGKKKKKLNSPQKQITNGL